MPRLPHLLAGAVVALALSSGVQAAVINGSDFTNGLSTQTIGGITWTAGPSGRTFETLNAGSLAGFTGVGISGGTVGEIDIGETLTGRSATAFAVNSITLGMVFNGPESDDRFETARINVNLGALVFTLTATLSDTVAVLSNPALGTVTNLSPSTATGGGVYRIDFRNPITNVNSLEFTALQGACGTGACRDPSDYSLVQIVTSASPTTPTGVPEPATLALFGAALLGLGAAGRRRATRLGA